MLIPLQEFDHDGDGKLDIWEVGGLVEQMSRERSHGMLLKRMLISLAVSCALLGCRAASLAPAIGSAGCLRGGR